MIYDCIAILIVIVMLFIVIPTLECKTYYGTTIEERSKPPKKPRAVYATCPDILNRDSDKRCVNLRDNPKHCKRPNNTLSDSSFDTIVATKK